MLEQRVISDVLTDEQKSIKVFGQCTDGTCCDHDCHEEKKEWLRRVYGIPTYTVCYTDIYRMYGNEAGCKTNTSYLCPWL